MYFISKQNNYKCIPQTSEQMDFGSSTILQTEKWEQQTLCQSKSALKHS